MSKLHILPNGDGIDLRRVTAVRFIDTTTVFFFGGKPSIMVEYEGRLAVIEVTFNPGEAALAFRDELIKLVNSKGQPTWNADQIEAAPDGSGFGDWYQRYRVWNRDKTVVLLHTDVLKDAIEFLNKG